MAYILKMIITIIINSSSIQSITKNKFLKVKELERVAPEGIKLFVSGQILTETIWEWGWGVVISSRGLSIRKLVKL